MTKPKLRIGLIGSGFMGKAHAFGYSTAARVFDLPFEPELRTIADINDEAAAKAAAALGFMRATPDWRSLVGDRDIDVVNITAPNALHKEMALAAIAAGKHVYCENPLSPLAADAREMAEAAEAAGVRTQVGFNYLCNPMLGLAREMIASASWAKSGDTAAYMPRTTWRTPVDLSPSDMIPPAVARSPTSAATRWRPQNSCSAQPLDRSPGSWAIASR